jgi:ubiquinone/menaquinone biosynthesis C-methylase UbiE
MQDTKKEQFSMVHKPPQRKDQYVLDPESGTEMARLMLQDHMTNKCMGGLFPEQERATISAMHTILDVACGPGAWVLEVAFEYPKIQVVGIDISHKMIEYARAQAFSQGLDNASFHEMNALEPLDFPDNHFDLVNARALFAFMSRQDWPKLLKECLRITRPGGIIRLTEIEYGFSNSPATEQLSGLFTKALQLAGRSFSPDGRHLGLTPMLGYLLREAGFENIRKMPHLLDASSGSEMYESQYQNLMVVHKLLQPFLVNMGMITNEDFEPLYQQSLAEMMLDTYCSHWYLLTAWGQKPLE